MTPDHLADRLRGVLLGWGSVVPKGVVDLRPVAADPGWWASPAALRLAGDGGTTPTRLARRVVQALSDDGIDARVSGPGFVEARLGLDLPHPPPPPDSSVIRQVFYAEPARTNPGGLAPPARWVTAATAPRTLRDPENPLLLVQLAHARLVRRVSNTGRRTADEHNAVRRRWVVVRAVWEVPRLVTRASHDSDVEPLARLLEEAARVGLCADELADDEASALLALLANGLALLGTGTPVRV